MHAADPPEKAFEFAIVGGVLPASQRVLRVETGDTVRLRLTSDAPGEAHLHGYRLEARVVPGQAAELRFSARASGRYRIEWHAAGMEAKGGRHHGAPLAVLEVRPR